MIISKQHIGEIISKNLKCQRQECKMSQEDMAMHLRLTVSEYQSLEQGKIKDPHISTLLQIGMRLGWNLNKILGFPEEAKTPKKRRPAAESAAENQLTMPFSAENQQTQANPLNSAVIDLVKKLENLQENQVAGPAPVQDWNVRAEIIIKALQNGTLSHDADVENGLRKLLGIKELNNEAEKVEHWGLPKAFDLTRHPKMAIPQEVSLNA